MLLKHEGLGLTLGRVLQAAHLGVATAQLSELRALNSQFQAQHDARQRQATLIDMLFRTEQRAKQLAALGREDPLVAAMFADEWLASITGATPDHFPELEHKRAWSAATTRLVSLVQPLGDSSTRALVAHIRVVAAHAQRLNQEGGSEETVVHLRRQSAEAEHQARAKFAILWKSAAGAVGALAGTRLIDATLGAVGGAASQVALGIEGVGAIAFLVLLIYAIFALAVWSGLSTTAKQLLGRLAQAERSFAASRAFAADPNGGGALARFQAEHPAFVRPLPNGDDVPLSSVPVPSSHVIERQTVVTRCKYCKAMSPVDAPTCHNCGAVGFGS